LAGPVLESQQFTIAAVLSDDADQGHRTLFSNWNGGAGNSTSSVFFGLTGDGAVRVSDEFTAAGPSSPSDRRSRFLLSARADAFHVEARRGEHLLARTETPLAPRNLSTEYVVGQQGNIDGEYWQGELQELVVFDRALSDAEFAAVRRELAVRAGLSAPSMAAPPLSTPEQLAWESLCHVLLNCNEFIYVD
jgi:hypothetical protein